MTTWRWALAWHVTDILQIGIKRQTGFRFVYSLFWEIEIACQSRLSGQFSPASKHITTISPWRLRNKWVWLCGSAFFDMDIFSGQMSITKKNMNTLEICVLVEIELKACNKYLHIHLNALTAGLAALSMFPNSGISNGFLSEEWKIPSMWVYLLTLAN